MDKVIKATYFITLVLGVAYMLAAINIGEFSVTSHTEAVKTQMLTSEEAVHQDDKSAEYLLRFGNDGSEVSMALAFMSTHRYVWVYEGDELLYSAAPVSSIFGRSTGKGINIVMLPAHTEEVTVITEQVLPQTVNNTLVYYYGDAVSIYRSIIIKSLRDVVMSVLIVILGCIMIVYWILAHKRMGQNPSIVYFGLFSIIIGLWSLNETYFAMLLIRNRTAGSMIGYVLLMLMQVPFFQFVRHFFDVKKAVVCNILSVAALVETVALSFLHMAHILEFKESARVIHVMMVLALCYMFASVVERIRKVGVDRKVKVNFIAVVALSLSAAADLFAYYAEMLQIDILGKIGILVYIALLGVESGADAFKKVEEGKKAEIYRNLAITDTMTGLFNRSAFEEWENTCKDLGDVLLVTFDLNNLKWCNDNLGHAAGDTYIIDSARIIQDVFGTSGKCYRIGGDEFCAVIPKGSSIDIEKYLAKFRRRQEEYNKDSEKVKIHIAVGYALHEQGDADIEETRSRADVQMYRNKKKIKENEG